LYRLHKDDLAWCVTNALSDRFTLSSLWMVSDHCPVVRFAIDGYEMEFNQYGKVSPVADERQEMITIAKLCEAVIRPWFSRAIDFRLAS